MKDIALICVHILLRVNQYLKPSNKHEIKCESTQKYNNHIYKEKSFLLNSDFPYELSDWYIFNK